MTVIIHPRDYPEPERPRELPVWCKVRDRAYEVVKSAGWLSRLDAEHVAILRGLPQGWEEALIEHEIGQQLLTDAGVPVRDRQWAYSGDLDSRIAQYVAPALARLERIAEAHCKQVDDHGGTTGDCNECGWTWPCPTYVWSTSDRDSLATWNPADDEEGEANG